MPAGFHNTYNDAAEKFTHELVTAWKDGLCDGLEHAARTAEIMVGKFAPASPEREALLSLALAVRQAEMSILINGLGEKNGPNTTSSVA